MPDSDRLSAESHIDLEDAVRQRAHQIWLSRKDRKKDTALEDWLEAERQVLGSDEHQPVQDRATVVGNANTPDVVL